MENYVYLVVFVLEGNETRGNGNIYKEGFIEKENVEKVVEEIKNKFMEDFDGYEVLNPLDVMKKGGICNFNW